MKKCSGCEQLMPVARRRYFGELYCSDCYYYLFPQCRCIGCGQLKKIYRHGSDKLCQQCLIKTMACHRCGKENYTLGKITIYGPVCNSCAIYYRDLRCCHVCGLSSRNVSRYFMFGEIEPICFKCVKARHFKKCSNCKEIKSPYSSKLDRSNLCKQCTDTPFKSCETCKKDIPSGAFGRKCADCFAQETLNKRVKLNKVGFSEFVATLYEEYSNWLSHRRGSAHAARQILKDRCTFEYLDCAFRKNNRLPNYAQFMRELVGTNTRPSTLTKKFFAEQRLFSVDLERHQDVEEKNRIRRFVNAFHDTESATATIFLRYYSHLLRKYRKGALGIRSVRLALTPAADMVRLADIQQKKTVDQELLNQYLWLHLGQMNAASVFINYLKQHEKLALQIPDKEYFILPKSSESKRRLKLQLIELLSKEMVFSIRYMELGMAYFHGRKLPKELSKIELYHNCKHESGFLTVCFAKLTYVMPYPKIEHK